MLSSRRNQSVDWFQYDDSIEFQWINFLLLVMLLNIILVSLLLEDWLYERNILAERVGKMKLGTIFDLLLYGKKRS